MHHKNLNFECRVRKKREGILSDFKRFRQCYASKLKFLGELSLSEDAERNRLGFYCENNQGSGVPDRNLRLRYRVVFLLWEAQQGSGVPDRNLRLRYRVGFLFFEFIAILTRCHTFHFFKKVAKVRKI